MQTLIMYVVDALAYPRHGPIISAPTTPFEESVGANDIAHASRHARLVYFSVTICEVTLEISQLLLIFVLAFNEPRLRLVQILTYIHRALLRVVLNRNEGRPAVDQLKSTLEVERFQHPLFSTIQRWRCVIMCMYSMCMYSMCMYSMCMYSMCMYSADLNLAPQRHSLQNTTRSTVAKYSTPAAATAIRHPKFSR